MSTKEAPPRLTPEQMMVVYLDEISGRLADQIAKGQLSSKSFTVGTDWYPLVTGWMSVTIYNDGAADLYIRLNDNIGLPWEEGEAPLKSDENLVIDLKGRKPKVEGSSPVIWLICKAGTAAVRIFNLL